MSTCVRRFALVRCRHCHSLSRVSSLKTKPRARDLGVPFDGTPGPYNAITDVKGVEVGHTTLISGEGKLEVGKGPVRTGVTAILPRGKSQQRRRLRRLVHAERQRRNDRHHLGRGVRLSRRPRHDHQHPQCGSRARRRHRVEGEARRRRHGGLLVVAARRRRNLGRLSQRHQRISRQAGRRLARARRRSRRRRSKKATSAAAPA